MLCCPMQMESHFKLLSIFSLGKKGHILSCILSMISRAVYCTTRRINLPTNGRFTELLLSDLVGDVGSHQDRHGDAQFPPDDL